MNQPQDPLLGSAKENPNLDPTFAQEVERLHRLSAYGRWLVVGLFWLSVGLLSLWHLRTEISLWIDYFTWSAVRYSILYNRLPALGLIFCIAVTISVLVWQTRNILWGRPRREQNRLEQQLLRIRKQGPSHPLWKFVRDNSSTG